MGAFLNRSECLCPVPQNSYMKYDAQCIGGGAFGRYLDNEGGVLIDGISALKKEAPENLLAIPTR